MTTTKTDHRPTEKSRSQLPDSEFGIPETHEFPLMNADHVRAAASYFRYAPDDRKAELARRILQKAALYGVEIHSYTILSWAASEE